jgi:hypothetical protein
MNHTAHFFNRVTTPPSIFFRFRGADYFGRHLDEIRDEGGYLHRASRALASVEQIEVLRRDRSEREQLRTEASRSPARGERHADAAESEIGQSEWWERMVVK